MSLFSLLARRGPNKVFFSIVVGIASGVVYSLLIPLIMLSLDGLDGAADGSRVHSTVFGIEVTHPTIAMLYLAAIVFIWCSRTWVDITMTNVSMAVASDLRSRMYQRILQAPLAAIERTGTPRLLTAMSIDMPAIVTGAQTAQTLLVDMVTLIGMLSFLAYVDTGVFWVVLQCIVVGVLSYQLIFLLARRYFIRAATLNDELQQSVQGLVQGFKELKLSEEKRRQYFDAILLSTERQLLNAQRTDNVIHSSASNYGLMLNFLFLGGIGFIFVSYHALSPQSLSSIMMVMLYISMPLGSVTSKIPDFARAKVAIRRIDALMAELQQERAAALAGPIDSWDSVRLSGIVHEHASRDEGAGFTIGPIDVEFRRREISFIVGGNGSGKSTLCKLLSLHYHATRGSIYFGADVVTDDNINACREEISAIYSDYYLFDRILSSRFDQRLVDHYLEELGLDQKVTYREGRFSTLSLSDGQRRRMALVAALVEDRNLLIFDEWAADQDPSFKEIFYREVLPSLKARGKAVVVISHDDRYFDVADCVVVMCEGRVESVRRVGDAMTPADRHGEVSNAGA